MEGEEAGGPGFTVGLLPTVMPVLQFPHPPSGALLILPH